MLEMLDTIKKYVQTIPNDFWAHSESAASGILARCFHYCIHYQALLSQEGFVILKCTPGNVSYNKVGKPWKIVPKDFLVNM